MRPYGPGEFDELRVAREHAAQIRADWQSANSPRRRDSTLQNDGGLVGSVRGGAGRLLIGLGQRVLPAEAEPCS
jgi:hypothetical protein